MLVKNRVFYVLKTLFLLFVCKRQIIPHLPKKKKYGTIETKKVEKVMISFSSGKEKIV